MSKSVLGNDPFKALGQIEAPKAPKAPTKSETDKKAALHSKPAKVVKMPEKKPTPPSAAKTVDPKQAATKKTATAVKAAKTETPKAPAKPPLPKKIVKPVGKPNTQKTASVPVPKPEKKTPISVNLAKTNTNAKAQTVKAGTQSTAQKPADKASVLPKTETKAETKNTLDVLAVQEKPLSAPVTMPIPETTLAETEPVGPKPAATPELAKTGAPEDEKKPALTSGPGDYAANPRVIGGEDPGLISLLRPERFRAGEEYGFDPSLAHHVEPILNFLYRFYWRIKVKGAENIPKDGRAVLVGNHAGILPFDALFTRAVIARETGRRAWPLIEDFFYYAPFLGGLLSRLGCVRACQENAQRLLAENELVVAFPEGIKGIVKPYGDRYRMQRFGRGGFVKLCLAAQAPVIPVAIVGSEEVYPVLGNFNLAAKLFSLPYFPVTPLFPWLGPLGLTPLPSRWTFVFGEPMPIHEAGPEAVNDRITVNRLAGEVKARIQKLIDMELGQRKSRWL